MISKLHRRDFLTRTAAGAANVALVSTGATIARADDTKTLVVAWDTDIDSLDPAVYRSIAAFAITANIYDSPIVWKVQPVDGTPGVFRARPGEYEASVAESWSFENEEKTLVLNIRKGLKF